MGDAAHLSLDQLSDDPDVRLSNDELSDGDTTDSGQSTDTAIRTSAMHHNITTRTHRQAMQAAAPRTTAPTCTMCDTERSEYICAQCGRLTFCPKCAISLHDNKFLGGHKLQDVEDATRIVTVHDLKVKQQKPLIPTEITRAAPVTDALPPSDGSWKVGAKLYDVEATGAALSQQLSPARLQQQAAVDSAQLAADRQVLTVRVRDLKNSSQLLRKLSVDASDEKNHCRELTVTATEAVRRKFDILRTLIGAKEQEFISVVEEAGRRRHEMTAKLVCDATVAVSETEGFAEHLAAQLDRLQANKSLFADTRRAMLDSSSERLAAVDDKITRFQLELDEARHISLGVSVPIDGIVGVIQAMPVPHAALPIGSKVDGGDEPISMSQFVSTPGVKQWTTDGVLVVPAGERGGVTSPGQEQRSTLARASFAKEVEALRATPMSTVISAARGQSPIRAASSVVSVPVAASSPRAPSPAGTPSSVGVPPVTSSIAKTAARAAKGAFPAELEALKRQIVQRSVRSAQTAAPGPVAPSYVVATPARSSVVAPFERKASPAPRAATPTRGASPAVDNFPGPGAYNPARGQAFGARSVLSTPPRGRR